MGNDRVHSTYGSCGKSQIICVECYPGVVIHPIRQQLEAILQPSRVVSTENLLLSPAELNQKLMPLLTDHPVFGVMNTIEIKDYFEPRRLEASQAVTEHTPEGVTLVIGVGAVLAAPHHDSRYMPILRGGRYNSGSGAVKSATLARIMSTICLP